MGHATDPFPDGVSSGISFDNDTIGGDPFPDEFSTDEPAEPVDGSPDVGTFTGLAFAPETAFIGGTDDGDPNVTGVSSPADIGASLTGTSEDTADLPGVDESNEVAETAEQTTVIVEDTAESAGDVVGDVAAGPLGKLAAVAVAVALAIPFLSSFIRQLGREAA